VGYEESQKEGFWWEMDKVMQGIPKSEYIVVGI